jgi:hypothetical protein
VREISQETEETEKTGDREFPREFPTLAVASTKFESLKMCNIAYLLHVEPHEASHYTIIIVRATFLP